MANLRYTTDIKADVLFRGGEPQANSSYDASVLEWINRAQTGLALGGLEFNETVQENWWWLRKDPPGVLVLQPPITTGTVAVTNNSSSVTFTNAPAVSTTGYFFKTDADSDTFRVSAHAANDTMATLDSVFTGETNTAKTYTLFKTEYTLADDVHRVIAPMRSYSDAELRVDGIELSAMDRDYPIALIEEGTPCKFAHISDQKVRFNRYGTANNGALLRLEYDYLRTPPTLTGEAGEEPIVPLRFRQILADIALFWLYLIKDDNRDVKLAEIVKLAILAMANEQRHRMPTYSTSFGRIMTRRPSGKPSRSIRTASGLTLY